MEAHGLELWRLILLAIFFTLAVACAFEGRTKLGSIMIVSFFVITLAIDWVRL